MDDDMKLLNKIYKNATSCQNSLTKIIPKTKDENLRLLLLKQATEYDKIYFSYKNSINEKVMNKAYNNLDHKNFYKEVYLYKNNNTNNNVSSNIALDISLMINNKSRNIADILIKENNSPIYDITKGIVEYQGATEKTRKLASTLLNNERNNIEELKKFI